MYLCICSMSSFRLKINCCIRKLIVLFINQPYNASAKINCLLCCCWQALDCLFWNRISFYLGMVKQMTMDFLGYYLIPDLRSTLSVSFYFCILGSSENKQGIKTRHIKYVTSVWPWLCNFISDKLLFISLQQIFNTSNRIM